MSIKVKRILKVVSFIGLGLTLAPALLFFKGMIATDTYLDLMLLGSMLWFVTAVFWIKKEDLG